MILTMQSNTITLLYEEFEKLNKKSLTEVQTEEVKSSYGAYKQAPMETM